MALLVATRENEIAVGGWIREDAYTVCSLCGYRMFDEYFFEPWEFRHCPCCGGYMRRTHRRVMVGEADGLVFEMDRGDADEEQG